MLSVDLMSLWPLCVLFICVLLWEIERTLAMRKCLWDSLGSFFFHEGYFFSHRTHRFYRIFLRTVSNSQNASGIQISQSVKTIVDTNKVQHKADILLIWVSRWLRPSLRGRGRGRGRYLYGPLCVLFICVLLWEKEHWRLAGEVFLSQRRKSVTAKLGDEFWERWEFIGW